MNWSDILGLDGLHAGLRRAGWAKDDLRYHVVNLKRHRFRELDAFAGGELTKLEGTPLYEVMVEATALRVALGNDAVEDNSFIPTCPHGFQQIRCNRCIKEGIG